MAYILTKSEGYTQWVYFTVNSIIRPSQCKRSCLRMQVRGCGKAGQANVVHHLITIKNKNLKGTRQIIRRASWGLSKILNLKSFAAGARSSLYSQRCITS
jgi:hypothetical protein